MKVSIRKERFQRVYKKRLSKALVAIGSLENLSNKSNYEYEDHEITQISGKLMAKVKLVMAAFGSYSAKDRFEKLKKQDEIQYQMLKFDDPEVYEIVGEYLKRQFSNPIKRKREEGVWYPDLEARYTEGNQNLQNFLDNSDLLIEKFENLYLKIQKNLKMNKMNDFYITNPDLNKERLTAKHNIDRLDWLKGGRTYMEIIDIKSPYRHHPDVNKTDPIKNLRWDINHNRVIQAPNNSVII